MTWDLGKCDFKQNKEGKSQHGQGKRKQKKENKIIWKTDNIIEILEELENMTKNGKNEGRFI